MADVGKSQSRQVGNLGNSPAGQTGYATGSRGNAYYEFGSQTDAGSRVGKDLGLQSTGVTPAGAGFHSSGGGQHYFELAAKVDSTNHVGKSVGLFGGSTGTGATQADTGPLPIVTAGSTTVTHYLMRARDPDCVTQPTYVYWTVTGAPDTTGSHYAGSRCGVDPLVDIVVEVTWTT
jgi:hypothetical protein